MNPSSRRESKMPYSQNQATAKSRCILAGCIAAISAAEKLQQRTRRSARQPHGKLRSSKGRDLDLLVLLALHYEVSANTSSCGCSLTRF